MVAVCKWMPGPSSLRKFVLHGRCGQHVSTPALCLLGLRSFAAQDDYRKDLRLMIEETWSLHPEVVI